MKRVTDYRNRDRELEIKMTPMIDVVFLLLVFFVWTASFRIMESSLPTSLSVELGSSEPTEITPQIDYDEIVIKIDDQENLTLNENAVSDVSELRRSLQVIARAKNDIDVIIHPENQVPMGVVIEIFDVAQLSGFEKVQFATPVGEL